MEAWLFAVLLAVAVIEIVLSLTWNRLYFSAGIPVFRRDLPTTNPRQAMPSPERLEAALSRSAFPPLVFRPLAPDRFGFREKGWGGGLRIGYTPVMHGTLTFERVGGRVQVVGLLNWFTLVFTAFAVVAVVSVAEPIFLLFLAGLLALIYGIQAKRFAQVARVAAAEWDAAGEQPGR